MDSHEQVSQVSHRSESVEIFKNLDRGTTAKSVKVTFVDPNPAALPIVTIISAATETRLMADRRHRLMGRATDPAGGAVTRRWIVVDAKNAETVLGTSATITWQPDQTGHSGPVEIRLEGTNNRGESAIARQKVWIQNPIR
jgi:hypothetical protein